MALFRLHRSCSAWELDPQTGTRCCSRASQLLSRVGYSTVQKSSRFSISRSATKTLLSSTICFAGALSMAAGEYISVASQKDTELADVEKERQQQEAGPQTRAYELEELAQIYVSRGLDYDLAKKACASS